MSDYTAVPSGDEEAGVTGLETSSAARRSRPLLLGSLLIGAVGAAAVFSGRGGVLARAELASDASSSAYSGSAVERTMTLVGSGEPGFKDGCGADARMNAPVGLTKGSDGNFYFVDSQNHAVRMLTLVKTTVPRTSYIGCVATVAGGGGGGTAGYSDGAASAALFSNPVNLAVGLDGTIFVADKDNHAIRGVSGGQVHTVVGSGAAGNLDGTGSEAMLDSPSGLAVMEQNDLMLIAERGGNVIREVALSTRKAKTVLGMPGVAGFVDGTHVSALFNEPASLELSPKSTDGSPVFVVADAGNAAVRELSVDNHGKWQVQTLVGGRTTGYRDGDPVRVAFSNPTDVAFDGAQNLIIADEGNNLLRYLDVASGYVSTLAGTCAEWAATDDVTNAGIAWGARFGYEAPMAASKGGRDSPPEPAMGDAESAPSPLAAAAQADAAATDNAGFFDGSAEEAVFNSPSGLATDPDGNLLIADANNHVLRMVIFSSEDLA